MRILFKHFTQISVGKIFVPFNQYTKKHGMLCMIGCLWIWHVLYIWLSVLLFIDYGPNFHYQRCNLLLTYNEFNSETIIYYLFCWHKTNTTMMCLQFIHGLLRRTLIFSNIMKNLHKWHGKYCCNKPLVKYIPIFVHKIFIYLVQNYQLDDTDSSPLIVVRTDDIR